MKQLLSILVLATLFSCEQSKGVQEIPNKSNVENLKVVIIDGCEYLQYRTHHYEAITHKGNCKNHK